jgi:TRAP-type mannitol/chloroaromatic compound transport system permease large subunit
VKTEEIIWAAVPYMIFDVLVIAMIIVWPDIALWLPCFVKG